MQGKFGGGRHGRRGGNSRGPSRQQAARIAVLAFVAADCAGIYYAQQRLAHKSAEAAQFAYETPGAPVAGAAPVFTPAVPSLAVAVPSLAGAVPAAAAPQVVPAPVAPVLAYVPAPDAPRVAPAAPALAAAAPADAEVALVTIPSRAERRAAAARTSVSHHASAPAATAFDNAFSLADETPETEHRFSADAGAPAGSLADLVAPREDIAPIFDKAGIAPVTGQSATVDLPADPVAPAPGDGAELPATQG